MSQREIELAYAKIFRYLADLLTTKEFAELSYYQVSRFIASILKLAFAEGLKPESSDGPT